MSVVKTQSDLTTGLPRVDDGSIGQGLSTFLEQLEVSLARQPGRTEIVLDDENGDSLILGNDYGAEDASFCEDHVVAFLPNASKTVVLKNALKHSIETGLSFGMQQWQGNGLHANELGRVKFPFAFDVTRFLENLFQGTHSLGFL